MIPRKLRIRNFLSYRDCEVDLTGLRLAVLCGPNGHGKSALLDAMTWALWGEGRGRLEEDRIHLGEQEMLVDFQFEAGGDVFQVIRKRTRGKASGALSFLQVTPDGGRIPLDGGTVSETQAEITRKVRMDYDTFVNSAFIAQGRANEFTRKRPAERKEVFRKVLGLERYQEIADAASERRKDAAAAVKELERNLGEAADEVRNLPAVEEELRLLTCEREALEPELKRLEEDVVQLRQAAADRQRLEQEAVEALQRVESLRATIARLAQDVDRVESDLAATRSTLARAAEVREAHALLQELRAEEQGLAALQREAGEHESRITDAERRIDSERARIEAELTMQERAVEAARQTAAGLDDLKRQQAQVERERAELQRMIERSEEAEAQAARLRTDAAREQERANAAARQNRQLKEREEQLETAEASCPVCMKPLEPGDLDHVRREYARQREELRASYEEGRALQARAQEAAERAAAEAARVREEAKRREKEVVQRERDLLARIPAAEEAAGMLAGLEEAVASLRAALESEAFAMDAREDRDRARAALASLGYDSEVHAALRSRIDEHASVEEDYRELLVAEERAAALKDRLERTREELAERSEELEQAEARLVSARDHLALAEDVQPRLDEAQDALNSLRRRDSELVMRLGQGQARREALQQLAAKIEMARENLSAGKEEESVYGELAKAFGRDGMQAMLIDQSLPRLEHTANDMLDRMTGGRIHVNLATQRTNASGRVTETLDIRISDEVGTRDYEMYSGGEAFRVDFALRIALARLLAERSGATMPTLIIDEGFGTQDSEGIDRLVQAITAIQDEFQLILVVTHLDELKERFERRIEVTKDHARGSLARVI